MTENMKAFMDEIQGNEELGKKFDEITGKAQDEGKDYMDETIALAKGCGITLTQEDFDLDEGELSDEDLENVSGGIMAAGSIGRNKSMEKMLEEHKKMKEVKRKLANKGASSGQGTEITEDQN